MLWESWTPLSPGAGRPAERCEGRGPSGQGQVPRAQRSRLRVWSNLLLGPAGRQLLPPFQPAGPRDWQADGRTGRGCDGQTGRPARVWLFVAGCSPAARWFWGPGELATPCWALRKHFKAVPASCPHPSSLTCLPPSSRPLWSFYLSRSLSMFPCSSVLTVLVSYTSPGPWSFCISWRRVFARKMYFQLS